MKALTDPLKQLGIYDDLRRSMNRRGITGVTGLTDSARTVLAYALTDGGVRLFIVSDEVRARETLEEALLFGRDVFYYPARDMMFYQADLSGNQITRQRMKALKALHEAASEKKDVTIVTTFDALMEKLAPASYITENVLRIRKGDEIDTEGFIMHLSDIGYEREPEAEEPGQYAVRGGIIDIYPLTEDNPVRIELWGDEIDSIREYDAMSQRSIEQLEGADIYPASDIIADEDARLSAKVKLEDEGGGLSSKLRKSMQTEAAHRLETYTGQICEALDRHQHKSFPLYQLSL